MAPGLGNGIGMIFNALKTGSPLVVTAGQQDTRALLRAPILSHDLAAMAAPVTKWSTQVERADDMVDIMHRAFKIANDPPFGPVFVALPIDVMEQETENLAANSGPLFRAGRPDAAALAEAASMLSAVQSPVIVAGDDIARAGAGDALLALAEKLGAPVYVEGLRAQAVAPNRHPLMRGGLPLENAAIASALGSSDCVLMLGGPFFEEVWFTPGSPFPAGANVIQVEESAGQLAKNNTLSLGIVAGMKPALEELAATVKPDAAAAKARAAALAAQKEQEREAQQSRITRAPAAPWPCRL